MSTKSVQLGDTHLWVQDVSISLLLAELIRVVEERLPDDRPRLWSGIEHDLRVHAFVSDFQLDLGLDAGPRLAFSRRASWRCSMVRWRNHNISSIDSAYSRRLIEPLR